MLVNLSFLRVKRILIDLIGKKRNSKSYKLKFLIQERECPSLYDFKTIV